MDSQVSHPHGHGTYEHDPHNVTLPPLAEGEDEHHHEKKSVLKKVKAKAKKIKETITGHGHNHDHDHDYDYHRDERHIPDDHDLYEEDEEMFEDPEVHGATTFESAPVRSAIPGQVENIGHSGTKLERSTAMREDPLAPKERCVTKVSETIMVLAVPGHEENTGQSRVNFGKTSVMEGEPHAPPNTPVVPGVNGTKVTDPTKTFVPGQEGRMGQRRVNLERPMGLEEDPHAPKDVRLEGYTPSNYQTKVTDPTGTGGEEAAVINPLLQSFDKMKVYDEPKPESAGTHHNITTATHNQFTNLPTGSHDQFSPEPVPPEAQSILDNSQLPESFDPNKPEDYIYEKPSNQSSYIEKISSATSAIADKADSAKNVVAIKLGYGEEDNNMSSEVHESGYYTKSSTSESASPVEYGKKIAATVTEKLTPVYEKVAEAGSNVMSKVHGGGIDSTSVVEEQDKGVSVKDYFMEKLRPGDEDRALSEVISDALHKRNEGPEKVEKRPMGKVTESEEVARRLETKRDENCGESMEESFVDNHAQGSVVDRLRVAVGTWFGLSGDPQSQASQSQTLQQSHGVDRISNSATGNVG